ncbi:MAG: LamG-like jellyroll fold domain-containing protein, partial [Planctomycetota bacterium]
MLKHTTILLVTLLGSFVTTVANAQSRLGHWCFEEREGATAGNSEGETLTGTLLGGEEADPPSWVPGVVGIAALEFAEGNSVVLNKSEGIQTQNVSWTAWVKTEDEFAGTIVSIPDAKGEFAGGAQNLHIVEGGVFFDVSGAGVLEAFAFVADGEWHHVALTIESDIDGTTSDRATIYVDGLNVASREDWDLDAEGAPGGAVSFGASPEFDPLFASLDSVQYWDFPLTAEEVQVVVQDLDGEDCELGPPLKCPDVPAVTCTGITVTRDGEELSPDANLTGLFAATAEVAGGNVEDLLFAATIDNGIDEPIRVEQAGNNVFEFRLSEGTWSVSIQVIEDPFCADSADICESSDFDVVRPPPEVIGHWCFEERAGVVCGNSVGESNEGLLVGEKDALPTWIPGQVGLSALQFADGNHVEIQESEAFPFADDFTWAAWVRPEDAFAGAILSKAGEEHGPGALVLFYEEDTLFFDVGFVGAVEVFAELTDEWHHVAVTVDVGAEGPLDLVTVYVDGLAAGTGTMDITAEGAAEGPMRIGFGADGFFDFFNGSIDNVQAWNFALTAEDIQIVASDLDGEDCEPGPPLVCPSDEELPCSGLTLTTPAGNPAGAAVLTGVYTATIETTAAEPESYYYSVILDNGVDEPTVITRAGESVIPVRLREGTWSITSEVAQDAFCVGNGATCVPIEITVTKPEPALLGQWCFEERSGEIAGNSASDGLDAELIGMGATSWRPGQVGLSSLLFDGDDDVAIVDGGDALDFGEDYTLAVWVRTTDENAGTVVGKAEEEEAAGAHVLYVIEGGVFFDIG